MPERQRAPARRAKKAVQESGTPGRRTLLTAETQGVIVAALTQGAFDYVAAASAGISERTFRSWLDRGRSEEEALEKAEDGSEAAYSVYAEFYAAVRAARAKARLVAESRVYDLEPFKWLRYGPGRDRPGAPGWTESDGSGPVTEVTQGDMTIKTYWGRASENPTTSAATCGDVEEEQ